MWLRPPDQFAWSRKTCVRHSLPLTLPRILLPKRLQWVGESSRFPHPLRSFRDHFHMV